MSNPNVVDQLSPINPTGQSTKTYQLTKASVSPSRIIGRDARGFPIEDTIPTVPWRWFLSADGCMNKVPIRTGSVPSMHADALAYEQETYYDLIMAGWIPGWLCPYSTKFAHITNGPFAAIPAGESDCGGSEREGGCEHLKRLGKVRRDEVLKAYNADLDRFNERRDEEYSRMRAEIVQGVGEAIAKHALPAQAKAESAKQRLRSGQSED